MCPETVKQLDGRYDVQTESEIAVGVLETFPYEYPGKEIVINIDTDEFSAVCPWSGLPDFATIKIDYVPYRSCIELRSLKYYLLSYRHVGIYQEHAVNRILNDLVQCTAPKWMKVTADYRIRGGIHTVVSREFSCASVKYSSDLSIEVVVSVAEEEEGGEGQPF
jgi:7-cyano-7-deazaguanine reductase